MAGQIQGKHYWTVLGSGQRSYLQQSSLITHPDGSFPVVGDHERGKAVRGGQGVVVLNYEDHVACLGLQQSAVDVTSSAVQLTPNPLENRRSLRITNAGPATVYIGNSSVTTANGSPLVTNESIAIDLANLPQVAIYAVSTGNSNVRILEIA